MKNGFIATTLIYSFFLVFCAVLISYIGISTHNKNLLSKANENIRKDIAEKSVSTIDIGSYVKLNISHTLLGSEDINFLVFNSDSSKTELVSSSIVISNKDLDYIKSTISSFYNSCLSAKVRIFSYDDLYTTVRANASNIRVFKSIAKIDTADNNISYFLLNNENRTKFTYHEPSNDTMSLNEYLDTALSNSNLSTYNLDESINVRLVITLPANLRIKAGSGNYSNPYRVSTDDCYEDSSLVNKILSNGYDNKNNYTAIGVDAATADEGIRTTQDDYGTSYYFRGNSQNNYLVFAGKCWRIIRITGNGAIKIILFNNSNSCNSVYNSSIALINGNGSFSFNNDAGNNFSIGFMYGGSSGSYELAHKNDYDSVALDKLKAWYDMTFDQSQKSKLADVIWCNDKSINTSIYNGYGQYESYYNAYFRVINPETYSPSLICPDSSDSTGKLSKFTSDDNVYGNGKLAGYKIGLITADEAMFAGLTSSNNSIIPDTYLTNNNNFWWTMTPSNYSNNTAFVFAINNIGKIVPYKTSNMITIRPVIALKPNVLALGIGTKDDPYVVE